MGALYTVFLLDQKCADWLDTEGVSHPPIDASHRYPTPREISEVLHQLPCCTVAIAADSQTREWSAQIDMSDGAWAQMRIQDFCSEETPHEFYFSKGRLEVVFTVAERLARICGPLVIVDDSSGRPVVISHGADPKQLVRQYDVA